MLFAVICIDHPDALELRLATRPAHVAHLDAHAAQLVEAGPLLDAAGDPRGSLFVLDVANRAAAEAFTATDPYTAAGVFESSVIRPYRAVFKDGVRLP